MTQEELWDKLDTAFSIPDRKQAKASILSLLQQAYEESLPILGAGSIDPENPSQCQQAYIDIGNRRYYAMFTKALYFYAFDVPGQDKLCLLGIRCDELLDEIVRREDLHGITFNPTNNPADTTAGFMIRKKDLTFVDPKE